MIACAHIMNERFKVAFVGDFQTGKSTMVNALVGSPVAEVGSGDRTTSEPALYEIPHSSVTLLDTPGNNSDRESDARMLMLGCSQADAFIYMLRSRQISDDECRLLRQITGKGRKIFTLIVNIFPIDANPRLIVQNSVSMLKGYHLRPVLFGAAAPVVNALKRSRGEAAGDEEGWRRLCYLLGVGQPGKSPFEKIAVLHDRILKTTG